MSNYLAPATVTAALARRVQAAAQQAVPAAIVEIGRPGASQEARPRVNLYLYHVTHDAAWRSADLFTRDARGQPRQGAALALNLYYLLSFCGDEGTLDPQRMLGAVVCELQARPVLTREAIAEAIAGNPHLGGSDLADAADAVRLTPVPLSLSEMATLWSAFDGAPHALSVVYQASVVLAGDAT